MKKFFGIVSSIICAMLCILGASFVDNDISTEVNVEIQNAPTSKAASDIDFDQYGMTWSQFMCDAYGLGWIDVNNRE